MSYLASTYLDGYDGTDLAGPSLPSVPAPGEPPPQPVARPDLVTLPGGITMPRSTLYVLLAVIAAVSLYLYLKRKRTSA